MKKLNFKNPKSIAVILLSMALVNIAYVSIFTKTEDDANIVNIEPLAVTLTTNSKYRIDISESLKKTNVNLKNRKIIWTSDNPEIIDVTECKNKRGCTLTAKNAGEVAITVELRNKNGKYLGKDTVYFNVVPSEKIHVYKKDEKYYVDKETNPIYKNDENYEELYYYTCWNLSCDVVTGRYHAVIKDGEKYLTLNLLRKDVSTDSLARNIGCDAFLCDPKLENKVVFEKIYKLIDNYNAVVGFIYGKENKYTEIYSINKNESTKLNFEGYQEFGSDNILLYDNKESYIYNTITNEYKEINYFGRSIKETYVNNAKYYYLSMDPNDSNKRCIILDFNFNPLYNSKAFNFAEFYNGKLYTYSIKRFDPEINEFEKEITVYDLDGSKVNPTEEDDFEKDLEDILNNLYKKGDNLQ